MEYYQKKQEEMHYLKSESPQNYESEYNPEEKDLIVKGLYSSIDYLEKLLCEAKQKSLKSQ